MVASRVIPYTCGVLMSINFFIFWAIPIGGMGSIYKFGLKPYLQPIYLALESNTLLRKFASDYIYTKPEHADFFAMSVLAILNCSIGLGTVFYWQLTTGSLPAWLIFAYYCSWVGIGGSIMGTAYGLAHKEGHYHGLYKKWIRNSIGNFFENWLGVFFGNIPWNFTTSHVFIHHRLDGGIGDTFYQWDLDRSSVADFMLYVHRVMKHMIGYSSIKFFRAHGQASKADQLWSGVVRYILAGVGMLALTRSFSFVFWIFLQPVMCMTYFLALINFGFHGFIEHDSNGKSIPYVNSSTVIDGTDDLFGEDDHMAHHYNSNVYYRDLKAHQQTKTEEFKKYKASVFRTLSIMELSIFVLLAQWDLLADYYVDYTETMSRDEIKQLLKERAMRKETTYEAYEEYLVNPTLEARRSLAAVPVDARSTQASTAAAAAAATASPSSSASSSSTADDSKKGN